MTDSVFLQRLNAALRLENRRLRDTVKKLRVLRDAWKQENSDAARAWVAWLEPIIAELEN